MKFTSFFLLLFAFFCSSMSRKTEDISPLKRTPLSPPAWNPADEARLEHSDGNTGSTAQRINTVQFNISGCPRYRAWPISLVNDSLQTESPLTDVPLFWCRDAHYRMKHMTDESEVKQKMRATFQGRRHILIHFSCFIFDCFPRYRDVPGLIDQDFDMLFGAKVSGNFLATWPTLKAKVIKHYELTMRSHQYAEGLLSAAKPQTEVSSGWDSDMSSILMLLDLLLPPSANISSTQAARRLVRYRKSEASLIDVEKVYGTQPFLLAIGKQKKQIERFYVIVNGKSIPCKEQTSVAAFDELFKAHAVFSLSYDKALRHFYTCIQTEVYDISVKGEKVSRRVKELREHLFQE